MAMGYYDIWHAVKNHARNAVDKDKKGVCLTVPLKPLKKPVFDLEKAFALAQEAIKATKNEKTIPKEMILKFEVYDPDITAFDAEWLRLYVDDFVEKVGEMAGSPVKPGCWIRPTKDSKERRLEIMISWREVGEFGGLNGILF